MLVAVPWRDTGCYWRARSRDFVSGWWHAAGYEVVEFDSPGEPFSRGASLNMAFTATDADVVVFADSDILTRSEQIEAAVDLARDGGLVLPFDEGVYLGPGATEDVWRGANPFEQPFRFHFTPCQRTPLVGGLNVVSRETWEKVGGWLELRGWGCQDIIFAHCCAVLSEVKRIEGSMVHLHHPKGEAYTANRDSHGETMRRVLSTVDPDELRGLLDELRAT